MLRLCRYAILKFDLLLNVSAILYIEYIFFYARIISFLYRDIPCVESIYIDKKVVVQYLATENKERPSSR